MNIGNKIKELRKQRGVTQEQLAESIGVSFQAVSKWENNIALPDISLAPALARYFGVSMDVLFDFNLKDTEEEILAVSRESWKFRESDPDKAREILEKGLAQYPNSDILLQNLLYVTDHKKSPDEVLRIASKIVDVTTDDSVKYDAFRFMAYAYKAQNDVDSARKILDQIPEIYFSRLSEKACVLTGEEKFDCACREAGNALHTLLLMKEKTSECFIEKGNIAGALKEYEQSLSVLDVLEASSSWNDWREKLRKNIAELKARSDK